MKSIIVIFLIGCSVLTCNAQRKTTLYTTDKENVQTVAKNYIYASICGDVELTESLQTQGLTKELKQKESKWIRNDKNSKFANMRDKLYLGYWPFIHKVSAYYAEDNEMYDLGIKQGDKYIKIMYGISKSSYPTSQDAKYVIYLTKVGNKWKVCRI